MIQIVTKNDINDVLDNPKEYVDSSRDVPLLKYYPDGLILMIGQNEETNKYYLTLESIDDDYTEDFYPESSETLIDVYNKILSKLI